MRSDEHATLQATARHEAGHACIALALGVPVMYATVRPTPEWRGHVWLGMPWQDVDMESLLLLTLAGPIAGRRTCQPEYPEAFDTDDQQRADLLVRTFCLDAALTQRRGVTDDERSATMRDWRARAVGLVDTHWEWIGRVASALEARVGLLGREIDDLRVN